MTKEKYHSFWETSFLPKAQALESKYRNIKFNSLVKDQIYEEYEKERNKVHSYMVAPEKRIDRHKIGAILTNVILK